MRSVVFAFAAVVLAGPVSAQVVPPPGSKPLGADPRMLFSNEDYPAAAQKNNEQGTVRAELTIGVDGRVKDCRVIRSSNSVSLDTATCNILIRRAKFTPARDSNGNPVEDKYVTPPITWLLEQDAPQWGIAQTLPGRYHCSAEPGNFYDAELVPLRVGQKMGVSIRLIKENDDPQYHAAASVILGVPGDRVHITVGRVGSDAASLYVAYQPRDVENQAALWRFPITDDWINLALMLDKRGNLTVSSGSQKQRFKVGEAITKTSLHCHSGEFEFQLRPPTSAAK